MWYCSISDLALTWNCMIALSSFLFNQRFSSMFFAEIIIRYFTAHRSVHHTQRYQQQIHHTLTAILVWLDEELLFRLAVHLQIFWHDQPWVINYTLSVQLMWYALVFLFKWNLFKFTAAKPSQNMFSFGRDTYKHSKKSLRKSPNTRTYCLNEQTLINL